MSFNKVSLQLEKNVQEGIFRPLHVVFFLISFLIIGLFGCNLVDNQIKGTIGGDASNTSDTDTTNSLSITGDYSPDLSIDDRFVNVFDSVTLTGECNPNAGDVSIAQINGLEIGNEGTAADLSISCSVSGSGTYSFTIEATLFGSKLYFRENVGEIRIRISQGSSFVDTSIVRYVNTPIDIFNKADLEAIPESPTSDDEVYILRADIDLSEGGSVPTDNWDPLGSPANNFRGHIAGNGHTISNMHLDTTGNKRAGFIGSLLGGTLSNLKLTNVAVRSDYNTGGAVGNLRGGMVSDVHVTGTVNGDLQSTGGVVGDAEDRIYGSSFTGTINYSGAADVGGVTGVCQDFTYIVNSYADVTINASAATDVGGICGEMNSGYTKIYDSYAVGTVIGDINVGGVIGNINPGTVPATSEIARVFAAVDVTANFGSSAGEFAGVQTTAPPEGVSDIFFANDMVCTGCDFVMGAGKTNAELKQQDTFTNFDFNSTWTIDEGSAFPSFR